MQLRLGTCGGGCGEGTTRGFQGVVPHIQCIGTKGDRKKIVDQPDGVPIPDTFLFVVPSPAETSQRLGLGLGLSGLGLMLRGLRWRVQTMIINTLGLSLRLTLITQYPSSHQRAGMCLSVILHAADVTVKVATSKACVQ